MCSSFPFRHDLRKIGDSRKFLEQVCSNARRFARILRPQPSPSLCRRNTSTVGRNFEISTNACLVVPFWRRNCSTLVRSVWNSARQFFLRRLMKKWRQQCSPQFLARLVRLPQNVFNALKCHRDRFETSDKRVLCFTASARATASTILSASAASTAFTTSYLNP